MQTIKKKLFIATLVYWFLLAYIIAALIWWFISLEKQNQSMTELKKEELSILRNRMPGAEYNSSIARIENDRDRNTTKYVSEGITFLALIILGAVFVYRAVRQQLKLQQQQQNFMMAITHELKTPIAVARLNLETLQKHQLDEGRRQKLIQMTLEETSRLNNLASNILVSSQLEGGRYRVAREELDFSDLVKNSVQNFQRRFPEREWKTSIESEVDLNGDPLLLEILVNNLLENAIKYSPKESGIEISLESKKSDIHFIVTDAGPGISDHEKKKVFEKFYRIGSEETRTTKGTGLGLYLCKKIAEDHDASIIVTDNTPTGCNFIVRFHT